MARPRPVPLPILAGNAEEFIEHAGKVLRGDTRSGIGDRNGDKVPGKFGTQSNPPTVGRVFEGIIQQIVQGMTENHSIDRHSWQARLGLHDEFHPLIVGRRRTSSAAAFSSSAEPESGPYWKRMHRDWQFWIGALFMAAALAIYVLSGDLAWVPRGHRLP